MNWMQLASPWRSPGGFVTRPDVRARPHTTPTYIRDICSYAISWVRVYLTIRLVFAPGSDSRSRTHVQRSHTLTSAAKLADSEIKLRITSAGVHETFAAVTLDGGGDFRRGGLRDFTTRSYFLGGELAATRGKRNADNRGKRLRNDLLTRRPLNSP